MTIKLSSLLEGFRPASFLKCSCLLVASVVLFGCPASKPTAETPTNVTAGGADKVIIRGSNTFGEELSPDLIAEFKKSHPAIQFDIETKATGYGIATLRIGQCDIAAASRAAIQEEKELAKEANLEMIDYPIATYSVAIIAHANSPVANLTKDQVREIFTGKTRNWKEVGGPDADIHLYIRDPISGTYLGFKEIALKNEEYAMHPKLHTNYTALVTAVAADPNGIGYCGLSQAKTSGVKALTVDGVEASAATVNSGKYAYARLVRFYTNKANESQPTKDFIAFVVSARGQEIIQHIGFAPKPETAARRIIQVIARTAIIFEMTEDEQKQVESEKDDMHLYFCNEYARLENARSFWKFIAIATVITSTVIILALL